MCVGDHEMELEIERGSLKVPPLLVWETVETVEWVLTEQGILWATLRLSRSLTHSPHFLHGNLN